jgi:hypothetical protein
MDEKHEVDARVKTKDGRFNILVTARVLSERAFSIQSSDYLPPGTKVETVLFLAQPETVIGEVGWSVGELVGEKMFYNMGIFIDYPESITQLPPITSHE